MAIIVQHNSPIAPATAPSADELLNAYQLHAQAIRGEAHQETTGDGFNPLNPVEDNQQDAQQSHLSAMEQFLAPVPMNQYDVSADHSPEKMQTFHDNLIHDPAFKEFGDDFQEKASVLREAVQSGQLDAGQARQIMASYGQQVIEPILDKHHGKHSDTHMKSMHDADHAAFLKGSK